MSSLSLALCIKPELNVRVPLLLIVTNDIPNLEPLFIKRSKSAHLALFFVVIKILKSPSFFY